MANEGDLLEIRIKEIIEAQLGINPEEVGLKADLIDDFGADSLGTIKLVMALEETFNFEIPNGEDVER